MICPNCGKSLWFVRGFCPFCKTQFPVPPRPKSVTKISWCAIIVGVGLALVVLSDPDSRYNMAKTMSPLNRVLSFASLALLVISGVVMLRGFNWARWAFVVTVAYNQLYKVFSGYWIASPPMTNIANIAFLVLVAAVCYYLFRPDANAFFSGTASQANKPSEGPQPSSKVTVALPQSIGEPASRWHGEERPD